MATSKIRNIIFDVGNVLFRYEPETIAKQILPEVDDIDFYVKHLFNSPEWDLLDRGDLSSRQLLVDLRRSLDLSDEQVAHFDLMLKRFPEFLVCDDDMKALFDACLKQYRVFILSNFQYPAFDILLNNHEFMKAATGIVLSGKVMMMKPEIGIYHYLLTQHRIIPQESVFIDDRVENVQTANRLLIKGILHKNAAQSKKELEKLKVKLK